MPKLRLTTLTADLRRALDFIDAYAAEHPEFADAFRSAVQPGPTTPVRTSRASVKVGSPLPSPVEVYAQGGEAGLRAALEPLTPAELVQIGKTLGLRLTQKGGSELAVSRIVERVLKEVNRGAVFSRAQLG